MTNYNERLKTIKQSLDKISPSFCAAKWTQVTIHLQMGHTHSCHHPDTHQIPLSELKDNPSALHNTNFKKSLRKMMLEGQRPKECQYCWNIEDLPGDNRSDRHYKSATDWSAPHVDDIIKAPWDANINPKYVEISFNSTCNFKCSYCAPHISSKWMEEIKQHGPYPTSERYNNLEWIKQCNKMPIPTREHNPYADAFWKWWPDLYKDLHTFRVTGGEPLMTKDMVKVLDHIIENPNPNLYLEINSNLGVPKNLLDKFIEKVNIITTKKLIKNIIIYTSAEAWGERASYIRHGMIFEEFWHNVHRVLTELPHIQVSFMSTFNALSVTSYKEFLAGILELKKQYYYGNGKSRVILDIPYLRHPTHQNVQILTNDYLSYMSDMIIYMESNMQSHSPYVPGFIPVELDKMNRIHKYMIEGETEEWMKTNRADFYRFFLEHDRRRNTNFLDTYPEMKEFWELCKKEAEK